MQGKGIIKFFLVVMVLVTAIQYLYVLPTNGVENDAADYAEQESGQTEGEDFRAFRAAYLDSISDQTVLDVPLLGKFTYQDLKAKQLNLGLDLKGGMAVVLQVDLREFIRSLARNAKDPTLEEALNKASQAQASAQDDYVTLFADAWSEVSGDKKLAPIFSGSDILQDQIGQNDGDGDVILKLRELADETVELTFQQLKRRIDKLGVVQPNISLDGERDLILVELPGIENPERARAFLVGAANLEFFDVKRIDNAVFEAIVQADKVLERRQKLAEGRDTTVIEEEPKFRYDTIYATDELGNLTGEVGSIDTVEITDEPTAGPL
ncbi:MAG: protein translocase subunit SecDF, partial [Bacteroidota bacterium]